MNKNVKVEEQDLIPVEVDENGKEIVSVAAEAPQVLNIVADDGEQYVMALTGERKMQYSSIDKDKLSFEEKAKFFNLINAEAKLINENIGLTINLKDIYMEVVTIEDMQTGEPKQLPRIVLIDDKKQSYTCSSPSFLNKLSQLIAQIGQPSSWSTAVPITFKEVKTKAGFKALVFQTAFK
jgi:uncharacterized FlaG/YvyC family protein